MFARVEPGGRRRRPLGCDLPGTAALAGGPSFRALRRKVLWDGEVDTGVLIRVS